MFYVILKFSSYDDFILFYISVQILCLLEFMMPKYCHHSNIMAEAPDPTTLITLTADQTNLGPCYMYNLNLNNR